MKLIIKFLQPYGTPFLFFNNLDRSLSLGVRNKASRPTFITGTNKTLLKLDTLHSKLTESW